jgi:hypothetical protein
MEHVLALAVEYDLTTMWNPIMRESLILHARLPWLTYIYGAMWTPVVVFDVPARAEGFDLGEVSISPPLALPCHDLNGCCTQVTEHLLHVAWNALPSLQVWRWGTCSKSWIRWDMLCQRRRTAACSSRCAA